MAPVGGIVADRVNKRNIMVILDFFTAAVILVFSLLEGRVNLVLLLAVCALCVFPMGIAPLFLSSGLINYAVMTVCCFMIMVCSTMFTVQMMSFVQAETPQHLIGKVIAVILTVSMCAQPLGNAMYGILFELCKGFEAAVILFAGDVSLLIAVSTKNVFKRFFTTPQE